MRPGDLWDAHGSNSADLGDQVREVNPLMNLLVVLIPAAIILLLLVGSSARMVQQYEQGIVFRFGRLRPGNRGPGLAWPSSCRSRIAW
jgi:hypothetical protein